MAKKNNFQGQSKVTPEKEVGIHGITEMRTRQFNSRYFGFGSIVFADVFCGCGVNTIDRKDIDGSPVEIMRAVLKNKPADKDISFHFTDIDKTTCGKLEDIIREKFSVSVKPECCDAAESINRLFDFLTINEDVYLYLMVDPNSPKALPKREIERLLIAFSNRVDLILNLPITNCKRCYGAKESGIKGYSSWWMGEINSFKADFIEKMIGNGRSGWVRRPIKSDAQQWTIIASFGRIPPRDSWERKGFFSLDSKQGKKCVSFYCNESSHKNANELLEDLYRDRLQVLPGIPCSPDIQSHTRQGNGASKLDVRTMPQKTRIGSSSLRLSLLGNI